LQNVIERAVVLSQGPVLKLGRDLLPLTSHESAATEAETGTYGGQPTASASSKSSLEEVEKQHIIEVLGQTQWVIEGPRGAAKILDIHPNTLRSRMKKLGIERTGLRGVSSHDMS
jgi:formate hydrogenlyase transcriptional activator